MSDHLITGPIAADLLPTARQEPRVPCGLEAVMQVGDSERTCLLVGISCGGALVEVTPMPPKGTKVSLRVQFPHGNTIFNARVVRDQPDEAGLQFEDLSETQNALLEKYVFLRTCQFGWMNHRRWFINRQALATVLLVTLAACVVLTFGGLQLIERLGITIDDKPYAVAGFSFAAMSPFCYIATVAIAMFMGPPAWRDFLLFGEDPEAVYAEQVAAIRKAFGFSRLELKSLREIHPKTWNVTRTSWMLTQMAVIFCLMQWMFLAVLRWSR